MLKSVKVKSTFFLGKQRQHINIIVTYLIITNNLISGYHDQSTNTVTTYDLNDNTDSSRGFIRSGDPGTGTCLL